MPNKPMPKGMPPKFGKPGAMPPKGMKPPKLRGY